MSDEQDLELDEITPAAEAPAPAVKVRPKDCQARRVHDRMACERCGVSWPDVVDGPACSPITFAQIADHALLMVVRAEGSLAIIRGIGGRGTPTDGGAKAERELAICKKLSRMVDKIAADPQLRAALNKKAR
jgi:hypothetical protein